MFGVISSEKNLSRAMPRRTSAPFRISSTFTNPHRTEIKSHNELIAIVAQVNFSFVLITFAVNAHNKSNTCRLFRNNQSHVNLESKDYISSISF